MNDVRPLEAWKFCDRILVAVSRSFALIIPRCPAPIDRCLCAGYLLCRLADTIEDDEHLDSAQRGTLYDRLLACVSAPHDPVPCERFVAAWPHMPEGGYGELVRGTSFVMEALTSLSPAHREPLADCVHEMVAGMRGMHAVASQHGIAFFCRDLPDLDRYCHHVAGTVGVMSTRLFEQHLSTRAAADPGIFTPTDAWRERGRRMGLGLQMTNIVKDACVDAGRGVSYIPLQYVAWKDDVPQVTPDGLAALTHHALGHLDEAIAYTTALPPAQTGIRTFLLGSILPAVATLEVAASAAQKAPKIDRQAMRSILDFVDSAPSDEAIRVLYDRQRRKSVEKLGSPPADTGTWNTAP